MKLSLSACLVCCCLLGLGGCSSSDDDDQSSMGSTEEGGTEEGGTEEGGSEEGGSEEGGSEEGGSEEGGSEEGGTEAEVLSSCQMVDVLSLPSTGGVFSTVLPADLSAPGAQIELNSPSVNQFISFDSSTGAVEFQPQGSRLSSLVEYNVSDAQGNLLATHTHRWVFSPVRVMPLGDSITSGVEFFDGTSDLPPMAERVGYRQFLFDKLSANSIAIDYFGQGGQAAGAAAGLIDPENNGYPGVDIDFINSKLSELLEEDTVDIILLHIGTNNTPADAQGIETFLNTLDTWEAANQPVLALVATIVPKRDAGLNAVVEQFNADLITRITQRENDLLVLVDQNSAVDVSDLSTEQIGLHPSSVGYEKMADAWFDALTAGESDALYTCP